MAAMATEDLHVKPLLFQYFTRAEFPDEWTVTFRKVETDDRVPDGWFHPSEHPLMTERQLYYYLAEPEQWKGWRPDYAMRMAVLMGSATHDFVQMGMNHMGLMVKPAGTCLACGRPQPSECSEHGACDAETGSRGHLDGILKNVLGGMAGFELKTCIPMAIRSIGDGDVEAYRKKWPYYYAQIQEYMRMTGLRRFVVIFMGLGTPWDMREFVVEYDHDFAQQIKNKYLRVRRDVELGIPPEVCCSLGSSESADCPARACEWAR